MAILVVEDYLPLARPLLRGLQEEGLAVHLARDDEEGDTLARTGGYDAVVVDWNIPRSGGAALVRRWRDDGLAIPVLLLLPSASPAAVRQGLDAGADHCLPLPFAFADLLARVRACSDLSNRRNAACQPAGFSPSASPQPCPWP
jgi:two-component system response regulator BasR